MECIFRVEGVYAAHLVMHCDRRPLTEGLLDKLALLCMCIELNLKKELPASRLFDQGPARVLADLAAGMPVSRRSLEAWFRATGLSRDGRFELAVVDYGYRDDERQLAVNACLRLLDLFPDAVVGLQDNRALVLRSLADRDDSFRAAIGRHALEFGGRAGLSDLLDRVEDLGFAYRQADIALQMAAAEEHSAEGDVAFGDDGRSDDGARDGGACRFRDYFVAYLLTSEHQDNELVSFTVSHSVPARLREADRAAGTQDCACCCFRTWRSSGARQPSRNGCTCIATRCCTACAAWSRNTASTSTIGARANAFSPSTRSCGSAGDRSRRTA